MNDVVSVTAANERRAPGRRRRGRAESPRRDLAGMLLLAASVVGSALFFGAQQTSVLFVCALLAAGSAVLLGPAATPRMTVLLLALASYTLLQIAPLPLALVERLSPASAAVWQGALRPFGAPAPGWVTLSVDPAATALEALKWFGYACVFTAAIGIRVRRGPALLAMLVTGSALIVCLVTLVHGILDIQHIYGLYSPPDPSQWLRGPFVNGNNLAGYLNLGLFSGVGLLFAREEKLPSWPLALAIPLLTVQIILTGSRGGVGALVLGALCVGLLVMKQRRLVSTRIAVLGSAATITVVATIAALAGPRLQHALADRDMHAKVSAWKWSLDMIADFPVFGVGRGAFETAFQPYRGLLGRDWTMVFAYAENFVLQWVADWGLIVGVGGLVAWAVLASGALGRARREPLSAGLAVGLFALLLQNLVDLALELYAVSALAVVALAGLLAPPPADKRSRRSSGILPAAGVAVAAIVVLASGASLARMERQRISKEYAAWVRNGAREPREFLAEIRRSMLRHPGEAYFPLVGSVVAAKAGGDPLRFIGRALERSPLDGQAHLRLAEVMIARKARQQALLHLRLAALYDHVLRDYALRKAANLALGPSDLVEGFPPDVPGSSLLSGVCERALGPVQIDCWREVVRRNGGDVPSKWELVAVLLQALETSAPPCVGESAARCSGEVAARLGEIEKASSEWRVRELRARELAVRGDLRQATMLLLEHCPSGAHSAACSARAVEIASRSRDLALVAKAAERYIAVACADAAGCAAAHDRLGKIYTEHEAFGVALKHYSAAATEDPSAERWLVSAEAAGRAGSAVSAHVAFDRARKEGDLNPEQQKRVEAVEAMLLTGSR